MEYDTLLDKAMDETPDIAGSDERLNVPDVQAQADGAFTRFTNLSDVADTLSREPEHLHRYVQKELGTGGTFEDGRGRYNGHFDGSDLDAVIDEYVEEYVICGECGLPDTKLVRDGPTPTLKCDACGAVRPVAKRPSRSRTSESREAIEEGETYDVTITGTGRKGDGVAERGKYTIFVTGAKEGDEPTIYVESVSGTLAFARVMN